MVEFTLGKSSSSDRYILMNCAGKTEFIGLRNVPDLRVGVSVISLRSAFYYRYYYIYYSQQTIVGEGISS